jgi:hypothetical protein
MRTGNFSDCGPYYQEAFHLLEISSTRVWSASYGSVLSPVSKTASIKVVCQEVVESDADTVGIIARRTFQNQSERMMATYKLFSSWEVWAQVEICLEGFSSCGAANPALVHTDQGFQYNEYLASFDRELFWTGVGKNTRAPS